MKRSSGILMHLSSLFGAYSIGSLGEAARYFIDFLSESGFAAWQMLPVCMTDAYNSPYASLASYAFNPYFTDLPTLFEKGLISKAELDSAKEITPYTCEFNRLKKERMPLLFRAAERAFSDVSLRGRCESVIGENEKLQSAVRFLALRDKNEGRAWQKWTDFSPDPKTLFAYSFLQYELLTEWQTIRAYARERGVSIIGDLPMYVSEDSADVWANPECFLLDGRGSAKAVAGVGPDYFCAEGQLWGNPLYDYGRIKEKKYLFWRERMRYMRSLFDGIRIDHFRAFDSYWKIPASSTTAKRGKWVKGPGRSIINAIKEETDGMIMIAEDLGEVGESVSRLVEYSGFLGMRVLEFAFLSDSASPHLPHNYINGCAAYSSTHDNNTLLGYLFECDATTRAKFFEYCGYKGSSIDEGCRALVRNLLSSSAGLAMISIQDLLGYGADTRMNIPGTRDGNWGFRITRSALDGVDRDELLRMNRLYGRSE